MKAILAARRASLIFALLALAGLAIFALAVGFVMQPSAAVVGQERLSELVCLQLAYTPERSAEIVTSFPQEARAAMPALLIPGDFMLAWGYGLVLFGLLGLLVVRLPENWQAVGGVLIWTPLAASLLDCIENVFLFYITTQLAQNADAVIPPVMPILGGAAATLKWIALAVVAPLFGFAGIFKGITTDRRLTSWLVYALLFVSLLSMVVKPIQDIPACF